MFEYPLPGTKALAMGKAYCRREMCQAGGLGVGDLLRVEYSSDQPCASPADVNKPLQFMLQLFETRSEAGAMFMP